MRAYGRRCTAGAQQCYCCPSMPSRRCFMHQPRDLVHPNCTSFAHMYAPRSHPEHGKTPPDFAGPASSTGRQSLWRFTTLMHASAIRWALVVGKCRRCGCTSLCSCGAYLQVRSQHVDHTHLLQCGKFEALDKFDGKNRWAPFAVLLCKIAPGAACSLY